jgi:hypothetical protein
MSKQFASKWAHGFSHGVVVVGKHNGCSNSVTTSKRRREHKRFRGIIEGFEVKTVVVGGGVQKPVNANRVSAYLHVCVATKASTETACVQELGVNAAHEKEDEKNGGLVGWPLCYLRALYLTPIMEAHPVNSSPFFL